MTRLFTLIFFIASLLSEVTAQSVIYQEDFEGSGFNFDLFQRSSLDNGIPVDTITWGEFIENAWILNIPDNDGNHVALSTSLYSTEVNANDWLILPQIKLGPASKLSWDAKSTGNSGLESYEVFVSTSTQSVSGCEINGSIIHVNNENGSSYEHHEIDLASLGYLNQPVYIGYNLTTANGNGFLALDNIVVTDDSLVGPVTLSFTVDMTAYDTFLSSDSGFVDIAGNFNDWDGSNHKLKMSETDSNFYSIEIPGFFVGNELEFRFRINGSWDADTVEFANGGLNRIWKIEKDRYIYTARYNNQGVIYGIGSYDDIAENVIVYPNPVKSNLVIENLDEISQVELIDTRGNTVLSVTASDNSGLLLDLNELSGGIYILVFTDHNGKTAIRKIIKQ